MKALVACTAILTQLLRCATVSASVSCPVAMSASANLRRLMRARPAAEPRDG